MGVAAHQAQIHLILSCGALEATPCLGRRTQGCVQPAQGDPFCFVISFSIQYSPSALSLLYTHQYYQLILQSPSVGLLILPSDLQEAAMLYIPAPSPAPSSPSTMFNYIVLLGSSKHKLSSWNPSPALELVPG